MSKTLRYFLTLLTSEIILAIILPLVYLVYYIFDRTALSENHTPP